MSYIFDETKILITITETDPQIFAGTATVIRPDEPGPPGPFYNSVTIEDAGDLISSVPGLAQKVADTIAAELSKAYTNPPQQ